MNIEEPDKRRERKKAMQSLTSNEIAGFAVGALLLGATIAAPKVDAFIASAQRSSLGMCTKCGDLKSVSCRRCKGTGTIKSGGIFGFSDSSNTTSVPCSNCQSKGCFPCPQCSKS